MAFDDTKVANDDILSAEWNAMVTDQKTRSKVFSGSGSPSGVQTPEKVGDIYIDTTADAAYIATGTANTNWEQVDIGVAWGEITGTVSNQTDLQAELDLKYDSADFNTDFDTRLGTKDTGDLSEGTNLYYTEVRVSANTDVSANTTHRSSDGKNHSDVVLNNTHRSSDGTDHSNVVLNDTHRGSDGKDHSDVVLNNTHRTSDGTDHSNVVLNDTHRGTTTGNPHSVTKSDVGLGNVVNLDTSNASNITTGTLPSSVLPPVALTTVAVYANETEMLAATTQEGDVGVRSDENKTYMKNSGSAGDMTDWTELQTPTDSVLSVNGDTGTVVLTQDDIGDGSTYVQTHNDYTDAEQTKVGYISITQAVDLDTLESDVSTNNAKVTNATHTGEVTGDSALTIADNVVDEANLKCTNSPTDNYLLSYDLASGGFTWVSVGGGDMLISTYDPAGVSEQLVGLTASQTLTNKAIDSDNNTITNIVNADIKAAAAIALNKLAAVTADRALVSDGSGFVSAATTTATEIGYVHGVTSAIQTQLDAKMDESIGTTQGDIIYFTAASTPARLAKGTASQVLTMNAGATAPEWADASSGGAAATFERTFSGNVSTGRLMPIIIPDELDGLDIKEVRISLLGLPTGQAFKVDVRKSGTATTDSIFTSDTEIEIGTGQSATNGVYQTGCDTSGATVGTPGTTIDSAEDTLSSDDVIWIYITQVGSTLSGSDLVVTITVA